MAQWSACDVAEWVRAGGFLAVSAVLPDAQTGWEVAFDLAKRQLAGVGWCRRARAVRAAAGAAPTLAI